MRTHESKTSTSHSTAPQKPFFGPSPEHAFFSTQRATSPPFFQPQAISPLGIQAKSATSETESRTQPLVQRMPAFESEITANGEVQRKLINSPQHTSALPIQAKLTIGEPGDKYEQEADRVASQVVEQINAPAPAQSNPGQKVQRQEEKKEELQTKPEITALQRQEENKEELQTKPEITALQRQEENKEELQTKPEITALQRQEENKEELQAKLTHQHGEAIGGGEASTDLTSAINSARGAGQPLDAGLQRSMGQAIGADFSKVRIHTDAQADRLNRSIQAKAFTTGQDVFFQQGAYEPGSRGGQELIAHELTHVVQQNGGVVMQRPLQHQQILQHPVQRSSINITTVQRVNTTLTQAESDFSTIKTRIALFKKTLDPDKARKERTEEYLKAGKQARKERVEYLRAGGVSNSLVILHQLLNTEIINYLNWLQPDDAWETRQQEVKLKRNAALTFINDIYQDYQNFKEKFPALQRSRQENMTFEQEHGDTIMRFINTVRESLTKIDEHVKEAPPPPKKWDTFMGDKTKPDKYHDGTKNDPIPVIWYKKPENYKPIIITKNIPDNGTIAGTYNFPNGPTVKGRLGKYDISVDGKYQFGSDSEFVNNKDSNDRSTQVDINYALRQAGVNMSGKDGDHVTDLGFGGVDSEKNYWPLKAEVNRRPFLGWRSQYGINYKRLQGNGTYELKTATLTEMVGKNFKIKGFMEEGDANHIPNEGKTPDAKSGVSAAAEGTVTNPA